MFLPSLTGLDRLRHSDPAMNCRAIICRPYRDFGHEFTQECQNEIPAANLQAVPKRSPARDGRTVQFLPSLTKPIIA
ncbi:MAG: hypothetical protein GY795_23595 [Desulfobacterales bacterium]|nr:hypothetical protein [Desulfobacterales bacterium]